MAFLLAAVFTSATSFSYASTGQFTSSQPINGVVMKGAFVNMKHDDNGSPSAPQNYIEDSLKMISRAGLDHARFVFYWEAYEKDPQAFIKEIKLVAHAADKYGVKIIYDNHQWHTSSWLEDEGTGFPWSLFQGNSKYSRGGGGNTPDKAAQVFWGDWWDRSVKDKQGKDGWTLMAKFLKKIVLAVDNHSSTLGYEILSEPHVDNKDQWSKIGQFNSFITAELRNTTSKTIIYSMNVPIDLNSPIKISPENLAKMAPSYKENIAFKISVYGVPDRDAYQKKRFDIFLKTRDLTGVPLYIGEWNNVVRTKEGAISKLNPSLSELTKTNAKEILGALKKAGVWGTAFWKWDYQDADTASFNLVSDNNGKLVPNKYLGILKDTVETIYGSSGSVLTSSNTKTGTIDTSTSNNNNVNTNDATSSNTKTGTIDTSTSNNNNVNTNDATSSNTDTKKDPEQYDDLKKLVDDIRNHVVDNDDISLNTFKDSKAYQGADANTQDCIDLAGKIGEKLGDQEIVHCSEDANYFENKLSNTDTNNNADNSNNNNNNNADDTSN
ncbi:MAG: hypothetical protein E6K94_08270 [Thaumarchaeota archaeon]|nr:MAG: hypothetical protein E6K94_08270 [Nitrososphaerota archaeon]